MKKQLLLGAIATSALAIGSSIAAPSAYGLSIDSPCAASYTDNVDNAGTGTNLGCELGTTNNDFQNPLQVNVDSIFGYDDWEVAGKDNEGLGEITSFPDSLTNGTYDLSSVVEDSWTDVMLVFKGGQGNIEPETYVSYLIDGSIDWTGTWTTPFANSRNDNPGDVSHITLYYREGETNVVPTPAAVLPILGGRFGAASRRKNDEDADA